MAQIDVKVTLALPVGVELLGYERCGDGHGFEVKFPLPDFCRGELCGHDRAATYECKNTVYVVPRDHLSDTQPDLPGHPARRSP